MPRGNFGRCAGCGAQIIWIKTKAGKNMPCNMLLVDYKADGGKDKIVLQSGEVVSGTIVSSQDNPDGSGSVSYTHLTLPTIKLV